MVTRALPSMWRQCSSTLRNASRSTEHQTHLLPLFSCVLLTIGDIVLRDLVEHVRNSAAWRNGIDCDLLSAAVLGEDAHERVDCALGT